MKLRKYDLILGFFIILEIAFCLYLALTHDNDYLCTAGTGCSYVQNSIYGTFFGIKLAWFGAISFSIFFLLFLIARFDRKLYWLFFAASIVGAALAVYFISLQIFVLKQICTDCVIIDTISIFMLFIVILEFLDFRKEISIIEKDVKNLTGKAL